MRRGLGDVASQIQSTASQLGVPPSLALAVAQRESGLNQGAIGSSGELGVFQLMPGTAAQLGVDPSDLGQNITGGITYLKQLYDRFGNWPDALVAYNEGPTRFASGSIVPASQSYSDAILAAAGISDGSSPADLAFGSPTSDFGGWGVSLDTFSVGGYSGGTVLAALGIALLGLILIARR